MRKQEIVVKKEIAAKRCEICHKEDKYDVETQICIRCFEYKELNCGTQPLKKYTNLEKRVFFRHLNEVYDKNLKVLTNSKELESYQFLMMLITFLLSICVLVTFGTHWIVLTSIMLVCLGFLIWITNNNLSLRLAYISIFKGIWFSQCFLAVCFVVISLGFLGVSLIFFLLLIFFIKKLISITQVVNLLIC